MTSLLHVELRPPASREGWGVLYVTRFVPTASAALGIPAPPDGKVGKLRPRWVGERRITFDLPITPAEPGEVPLEAQVQLYLCSQEECFEDRPFTLTTRVPVAPPAD